MQGGSGGSTNPPPAELRVPLDDVELCACAGMHTHALRYIMTTTCTKRWGDSKNPPPPPPPPVYNPAYGPGKSEIVNHLYMHVYVVCMSPFQATKPTKVASFSY